MPELSSSVTEWLKRKQPLTIWWQRNYPGLRQVSKKLAARLRALRDPDEMSSPQDPNVSNIPVDTPGLRYFDYGLVGGAIDYRMRMEFTPQWVGDPARSAFTRASAGKRGSLAYASAALLADCAPALAQVIHAAQSSPYLAQTRHMAESLSALAYALEEQAELAPRDWTRRYATARREQNGCWTITLCWPIWTTFIDRGVRSSTSGHSSLRPGTEALYMPLAVQVVPTYGSQAALVSAM
jgi:hypothetical protein